MCYVGTAKAVEVTINGIKYDVITKAKQAKVISGGNYSGDIVIPSEITYNNVTCNVTSIGNHAFFGCDWLTSITIPNSVTSIGDYAFRGCTGLTSITIPNSVTSIGDFAFDYCSGLTSITIPNSVTSIGSGAFQYCYGLTNITIPNSVKSIGIQTSYRCSGLTSITIPNSVTSIEWFAFSGCYGLTSITIPNSVTSIENEAFAGCSGLESIVVDPGNTKYDSRDNCNVIIETESNTLIAGCKNTVIPNSVTSIGDYAFERCSGLTSITIPDGVTSIGKQAFYGCSNLTDVYCLATNIPATGSYAFGGSYPENMTLHVPAEAINSYKTTEPWSNFGSIIAYVTPKCAAPVIEYCNGELIVECETENAEFVTEVTNDYTGNYNSNAIALTATYNISVYATAEGYENSDIVNATLCWIECDCDADDNTDIINIPAKAVLVTSNNGTINISCSLEGENVAVYSSDAMFIGSTTIEDGCASIQSGLSKGNIAIIKIGEKSIKVILN